MPDTTVIGVLERVRSRWRLRSAMFAVAVGGAVFAAVLIALTVFNLAPPAAVTPMAAAIGAAAATALAWRMWPLSLSAAARLVEANRPLDNLLVTAAELEEQPRPVRAEIVDAITRLAAARAHEADEGRAVPIGQPIAVALAVSIGCGLLVLSSDTTALLTRPSIAALGEGTAPAAGGVLTVRIAPPSYTRRRVEVFEDPVQVTAIAGSEIRIVSGSRVLREWRATESASLELRVGEADGPRFLSVIVVPDAPPSVRIHTPGRDTVFAQPGPVAIGVDGRDDLGLTALTVKFTKASGGGENVTFTEGEVPITVERSSDRQWAGRGQWRLDGLGLTDGDVLVYRAVARDGNPAGEPVLSDAYLIEIGRAAEIASAGFALPGEERKYAISQQMVIYKTEQLLARRRGSGASSLPQKPDDWMEQARMIAIEQRMVRAEVVFLSGGEVEDEVEEAAQSHELAEGRLENQGRAEMVRAINFMSRAEAQLNDGRADQALVLERQALASLERALDRRRYFLRTLPDRSRIDLSRRLTGRLGEARAWVRARSDASAPPSLEQQRAVMRELADAADGQGAAGAALAARVAAVNPKSLALQKAAVAMARASSDEERRETARAAMRAVTSHALSTLPSSTPLRLDVDPLAGRLADVLAKEDRAPK